MENEPIQAIVHPIPLVRPKLYACLYFVPPDNYLKHGYWMCEPPREDRDKCEEYDIEGRPGECIIEIEASN